MNIRTPCRDAGCFALLLLFKQCDEQIVKINTGCYNYIQIVLFISMKCAIEVMQMIKNNIKVDVKAKCIKFVKTQAQLAEC